jgi:hypothetical protein
MHGLIEGNNWIYIGCLTGCCTVSVATEINPALFSGDFVTIINSLSSNRPEMLSAA